MENKAIMKVLEAHFVPYKIIDGRVIADSMIAGTKDFEITEDLTGISMYDLKCWLGY